MQDAPKLVKNYEWENEVNLDKALDNISLIRKYSHILEQSGEHIDKMWTLLDCQSTDDVICNKKMLRHVCQIKMFLRIHLAGGVTKTNWIRLLPG